MSYRYFRKQRRTRAQMGSGSFSAVLGGGDVDVGGFAAAILQKADATFVIDPDGDAITQGPPAGQRWVQYMNFDASKALIGYPSGRDTTTTGGFWVSIVRDASGNLYLQFDPSSSPTTFEWRASDGSLLATDTSTYEKGYWAKTSPDGDTLLKNFDVDFGVRATGGLFKPARQNSYQMSFNAYLGEILMGGSWKWGTVNTTQPTSDIEGTILGPPPTPVTGVSFVEWGTITRFDADDIVVGAIINSWETSPAANMAIYPATQAGGPNIIAATGGAIGNPNTKPAWGTDDVSPVEGPSLAGTATVHGWVAAFDVADDAPRWAIVDSTDSGGVSTTPESVHVDAEDNVYWGVTGYLSGPSIWDRYPTALSSTISFPDFKLNFVKSDIDGDTVWQKSIDRANGNNSTSRRITGWASTANSVYMLVFIGEDPGSTDLVFGPGEGGEVSFTADAGDAAMYVVKLSKSTGNLEAVKQVMVRLGGGAATPNASTPMYGIHIYPVSGKIVVGFAGYFQLSTHTVDFGDGFTYTRGTDLAYSWFAVEMDADLVTQGFTRIAETDDHFGMFPRASIFAN